MVQGIECSDSELRSYLFPDTGSTAQRDVEILSSWAGQYIAAGIAEMASRRDSESSLIDPGNRPAQIPWQVAV